MGEGKHVEGRGRGQSLTSSASFSSVSSLFSCWSFALFLKASFSGLPRREGQVRLASHMWQGVTGRAGGWGCVPVLQRIWLPQSRTNPG